jgi:hypothetical protein
LPNGQALTAGIGGARLLVLDRVGHELPLAVIEPLAEEIGTFVGAS